MRREKREIQGGEERKKKKKFWVFGFSKIETQIYSVLVFLEEISFSIV